MQKNLQPHDFKDNKKPPFVGAVGCVVWLNSVISAGIYFSYLFYDTVF